MEVDEGYIVEKEIIKTKKDEDQNTITEKQIIHMVKDEEQENLIGMCRNSLM